MHFAYHHRDPDIYTSIRNSSFSYLLFTELSGESMEARYHLLSYLYSHYQYTGPLEKDVHGKPIPISMHEKTLYWSLSHTENTVVYAVSDHVVGIDIAEYQERGASLLQLHGRYEYDILGGENWTNFYLLWTAKESLIKAYGNMIEDMKYITLQSRDISKNELIFLYKSQFYTTLSYQDNSIFLSVTTS